MPSCPLERVRETCSGRHNGHACECKVAQQCQNRFCGVRLCGTCFASAANICPRVPENEADRRHKPIPICSDCNIAKEGIAHAHQDFENGVAHIYSAKCRCDCCDQKTNDPCCVVA